jgi:hypothetical protein
MGTVKITHKSGGKPETAASLVGPDVLPGDNILAVWALPTGSFAQVISYLIRIFLFPYSPLWVAII